MKTRLVGMLSTWATQPDAELRQEISQLGEPAETFSSEKLRTCRTLFARALEAPGGMKILTIHAFASQLLRKFPMEAGLSPQFRVVVDTNEKMEMIERALEYLVQNHIDIVDELVNKDNQWAVEELIKEIANKPTLFRKNVEKLAILEKFELPLNWTDDSWKMLFSPEYINLISALVDYLKEGSKKDIEAAEQLSGLSPESKSYETTTLFNVFLNGKYSKEPFTPKIGTFPTKGTRKKMDDALVGRVEMYMQQVSDIRGILNNYDLFKRTYACHQFAWHLVKKYDELKQEHGCLDYEDLLVKTHDLLLNPEIAQWVLYQLDTSIDHILVDEAQDVNSLQWDIVSKLSEEYTAGDSRHVETPCTMFAVGDEKQSIFGFQGAEPERFQEMSGYFKEKFEQSNHEFINEELKYSFRSSELILKFVDTIFKNLSCVDFPRFTSHETCKIDLPGRIDNWGFIEAKNNSAANTYENESEVELKPEDILAKRIAGQIKYMLANDVIPDEGEVRKVSPGDILILVQTRTRPVYSAIARELKHLNLPFAGADRINLNDDLSVQDLLALLSFLALTEDDLSLAAVMKSPLFGFTENDLFNLAYQRSDSLWNSLKDQADCTELYQHAVDVLTELKTLANHCNPYDILERILTVHRGRELFTARLGTKSEEFIDLLIEMSLKYETEHVPSLTGFLEWIRSGTIDVTRQIGIENDKIRLMTIHGAKGLESPIVILPDTSIRRLSINNQIILTEDGFPIWKDSITTTTPCHKEAYDRAIVKEKQERMRLFYVALTRCKSWLIFCGAGKSANNNSTPESAWNLALNNGITNLKAMELADIREQSCQSTDGSEMSRIEMGTWPRHIGSTSQPKEKRTSIPVWINQVVKKQEAASVTISPSNLGGEKSIGQMDVSDNSEDARIKGTLLHLLLEYLPEYDRKDWRSLGKSLMMREHPDVSDLQVNECFEESTRILDNRQLSFLFDKRSLAEVAITAEVPRISEKPVFGYIDRLFVSDEEVLAVDFKSNRIVPQHLNSIPEGIIRQMGAYQASLEKIYPKRLVSTAILWTSTAELMRIPREMAQASLERIDT